MATTRKSNPRVASRFFQKTKINTVTVSTGRDLPGKNHQVLMDAFNAWQGLENFRLTAERNKMYTFEDQWSDKVKTRKGWITERESILNEGNIPIQNNRIRSILRSIVGVFQSSQTEPVCISRDRDEQDKGEIMSATLQYIYQLNKLWGLDSFNLQYFLVTGLAAFRSTFGWRNGKMDVWTDVVNYNHIFFDNHMTDPRHWDCHLVGQIYDCGIYELMAQFADGSKEKADRIRRIYRYCDTDMTMTYLESNLTVDTKQHLNFFIPKDNTRCRVIEVWKKESKERLLVHDHLTGDYYKVETGEETKIFAENTKRIKEQMAAGVAPEDMKLIKHQWFIDNYWYYYYLSPTGDVLKEGETPFWHESHPYTFKVYPFFDGRVYPFVSGFIDQQRYINRLIMLQDFITRSSAKGVLAIHEDSIPDGYTIKDFTDEWAVFNGVILYKGKPGVPMPQQIVSHTTQLGVTDMLSIQLKLLEDVSGVQGALQGRQPQSGTPAALYAQQVQNSATSLTELFESYRELREERDTKNMKLIQQFYTEPRYINITGKNARPGATLYNPNVVRNAEFDLALTESTSTPAYRQGMNNFLMQLFQMGQITLSELLENGAFPFADKLLQTVNARQMEMQQGEGNMAQTAGVMPEDVKQAIGQNQNPLVRQMLAS
jgi:hypothetical protein